MHLLHHQSSMLGCYSPGATPSRRGAPPSLPRGPSGRGCARDVPRCRSLGSPAAAGSNTAEAAEERGLSPSPTSAQQRHGRALVESSPAPALLLCPWPLVPSQDLVAATSKARERRWAKRDQSGHKRHFSRSVHAGEMSWRATSSKVAKI